MTQAKTLMVQGTSSSVGKSIMVAALCRILRQDGWRVAPFKAQNMALNSFVTEDGGEIGRAQAVQAAAAGIKPAVEMNPVLLKPEADSRCQVIVGGRVYATISAGDYYRHTPHLLEAVRGALGRLRRDYQAVVIEGAGSPAEINLKDREIANMRIARLAAAPVLLVGDIDRGGVFAALVGTLELLEEAERRYIRGFIINKFRGDLSLLKPAVDYLERRTGIPVLGVVPYLRDMRIAQEDSVYLDERQDDQPEGGLDIAVIRLPHISNYDDFDPLEEGGCRVRYVSRPDELGSPHLVILPGTKTTVKDLEHLRRSGLAGAVLRLAEAGTPVMGICGGYQMLGRSILDPQGVESAAGEVSGLGLLDVVTSFVPQKSTRQVRAQVAAGGGLLAGGQGQQVEGYEIHMGQSQAGDAALLNVVATPQGPAGYPDGAVNAAGTVMGTYLHGLFHNAGFRRVLLDNLSKRWGLPERAAESGCGGESPYDRLAETVRRSLDMAAVYEIMEKGLAAGG